MKLIPNKYFMPSDFSEKNELGKEYFPIFSPDDMKKTQKALVENLEPWNTIETPTYKELLIPSLPIKTRKFVRIRPNDPDIDRKLEDLQYICYIKKEYPEAITLIDDILKHHSKSLIRSEYIHIILIKAFAYHQLIDPIEVHKQLLLIEPYLKDFDNEQLVGFYDFKWNIFLYAWEESRNPAFFPIALDAFNKLLDNADIHPLDPDVYQRTKFKIGRIFLYMHRDQEAKEIFKEIIRMSDDIFEGDDLSFRTNKKIKHQSGYYLRMLSEKEGE